MKQFTIFLLFISFSLSAQKLPKGFTYLSNIESSIRSELRYITNNNFIGKPIDGYKKNKVIVTTKTAMALKKVQNILLDFGFSLKIYDAYRPQQSVDHFVRWANKINDTLKKSEYYPDVAKKDLFKLDYIALKSGHTRGSTVDLTIVDIVTGQELDMGSPYDFFGIQSHPFYHKLTKSQKANRLLLRNVMLTNGFKPYDNEWWHFTLANEPFPKTYFNFPVE